MPFGARIVLLLFPIAVSGQTVDTSALDAHQFTLGRVGFVGHHTAAERAMQHIASLPHAAEVFQAVIDDKHRSNVAKLYALCGLKQVRSPGFLTAARQLASLSAEVSVMHGDVMEKEKVRQMVHRIRQHLCVAEGRLT